MKRQLVVCTTLFASSFLFRANANIVDITFTGPGVSGAISLNYGPSTDASYPQAFEVNSITGTFSDSNNGLNIVNASVGPLLPIRHDTPEPGNLLAPNDFSRFAVSSGLPPENGGFLTYDNLYWPGGSPQTATDYPPHGGFLDIYGLMFEIGGSKVVNFWSNGDTGTGVDYGIAVATADRSLDYVAGGVTATTPEPSEFALLAAGLVGLWASRRSILRRRTKPTISANSEIPEKR
jgi:hypothetical protein